MLVVVDTRGKGRVRGGGEGERRTYRDSTSHVVQAFEEELGVGGGDWLGWHVWVGVGEMDEVLWMWWMGGQDTRQRMAGLLPDSGENGRDLYAR